MAETNSRYEQWRHAEDELTKFLGFDFVGPGVVSIEVAPEHMNRIGLISGPVTYALVDYAMGSALWNELGDGELCATLSISLNYLQSASTGTVTCRAAMDRRNRTAATLRATVEASDGRLMNTAIGSFSIFKPKPGWKPNAS
jgi:uncharacterized protein (TIGR00369 family)